LLDSARFFGYSGGQIFGGMMKRALVLAILGLAFSAAGFAQNADTDPATADNIQLYLRTMRSHDMVVKMMAVQSQSMEQLVHDQIVKDKGSVPPDFEARMKKLMDELVKGMPVDEITQAMVPAYQKHFTNGDILAMNAFYSSPVGQKVLQELPDVMQEGMKAAMPRLSSYLTEWQKRMKDEMKDMENSAPKASPPAQP
jgi:hypothetical protein